MVLEGLREAVRKFLGGGRSYEESVNEFIRDLQRELIRADVNVALVKQLTDRVRGGRSSRSHRLGSAGGTGSSRRSTMSSSRSSGARGSPG
ncbi:MAG: Signal recognition particle GTPase [uncultured Acidilobus sp. JCHS]|nr:MAG: Signal recognition particle GTPase [uncultured Acidilobus sp. JCHS]